MIIHPTSIIHPSAELADDVEIGPFSLIEEDVSIGKGTRIEANVIIKRYTKIGKWCMIHSGAIIGDLPQIKNYKQEESYVVIGDYNIIREYVTIHRGWKEGEATKVGNDNFIMANAHIAHNCEIGNQCILANFAALAGHVQVEDRAFISALVGVHQFVRIGALSMVSGLSKIVQDVPPYMIVAGQPATVAGINNVGLRRAELSLATRDRIKACYKLLYRSGLNTSQALERIEAQTDNPEEVNHLLAFIRQSKRGICPIKRSRRIESIPEEEMD